MQETNASGIGIFEYDVPTGYTALSTKGLKFIMAYTTIKKSTDYFNTKLYTGNGSSSYAITGVGHQPDFVWIKKRDGTVNHLLT